MVFQTQCETELYHRVWRFIFDKFMNLPSAVAGVLLLAKLFLEHLLLFNFFNSFMCHSFAPLEATKGICTTIVEGIPFRGQGS
jgi:hypothetical protein